MSVFQRLAMPARLPRFVLATFMLVAGVTVGAGALAVAQSSDHGVVHACVNRMSGAVRIVQDSGSCTRYEQPLDWNQQGIPGEPGQDGQEGADGLNCWDVNGNGFGDLGSEDLNIDGVVDVRDCQGPQGPIGPQGPSGESGLSVAYSDENRTFIALNKATSADYGSHVAINGLELPAGTFVIQAEAALRNNELSRQFVHCYFDDGIGSLISPETAVTIDLAGVDMQAMHTVEEFAAPTTVTYRCFVFGTTGDPVDLDALHSRITAIQINDVNP